MRVNDRAIRLAVTAVILVGLSAAPAGAAETPPAADATVEWVVGSDDSFADAVAQAVELNGAAAVGTALGALADAAASGADVGFPALDALPAPTAARIADATAAAVATGASLPASARTLTIDEDEEPPFPFEPDQTYGRVLEGGRAYEQMNWLRRGVSEEDGSVRWTDVVRLRWVTYPAAGSTHVVYRLTHPKNETGYFGAARAQTWAFVGADVIGTGHETPLASGSALTVRVRQAPAAHGAQLWHGTTLTSVSPDGNEWSSSYRTIEATCAPAPDRTCTYAP